MNDERQVHPHHAEHDELVRRVARALYTDDAARNRDLLAACSWETQCEVLDEAERLNNRMEERQR